MKVKGGLLVLLVLGGIWIGVAPFWLGYAPAHGPVWSGVSVVSIWMGALIVVAGLVGLIGFAAGGLAEADRQWRKLETASNPSTDASKQDTAVAQPKNPPVVPEGASHPSEPETMDTDEKLQALVEQVLKNPALAFEKPS